MEATYREATNEEIQIAAALWVCSMLPGTFDKRFSTNLWYAFQKATPVITDKQSEWLYRLLYKYRKQVPDVYGKHKNNRFCSQKSKLK